MAESGVVARWLPQNELSGRRRSVTVGPDEAAIVITDGEYGESRTEEKVRTRSLFRLFGGPDIEVLVAQLSPVKISFPVLSDSQKDSFGIPIMTKDGKVVAGSIKLTLSVRGDMAGQINQMRHGRTEISDSDVADVLCDDLFSQVVRPNVAQISSVDLRGSADEFAVLYGDTQLQLNSLLDRYGLELTGFSPALIPREKLKSSDWKSIEHDKNEARRRPKRNRSTVVIFNKHGEVLLVRKKNTRRYSLPGGGMRKGERSSGAAKRHIKIETNLSTHETKQQFVHETKRKVHTVYSAKAHGKFKPNTKVILDAIWWDQKRGIEKRPHVEDILGKLAEQS